MGYSLYRFIGSGFAGADPSKASLLFARQGSGKGAGFEARPWLLPGPQVSRSEVKQVLGVTPGPQGIRQRSCLVAVFWG